MAKFLTTSKAIAEIEDIFKKAARKLVLISPYLDIPDNLFQNLIIADKRNVKIILVYGKNELHREERERLQQLGNLRLLFLDNLHAKCFFNEETMVITSLNMLESSTENREMGVLITKREDAECFSDAVDEATHIMSLAVEEKLERSSRYGSARGAKSFSGEPMGHCIRCGTGIEYDPEKPYCYGCFTEWPVWDNPYYVENHCHLCGKPARTSKAKPLCTSCYNKSQR